MHTQHSRLLVSGASGKLGQRVLHHLLDQGVAPDRIIATSRSVGSLTDAAESGIEVRYADLDDPATLHDAFTGADRMLLISTSQIVPIGTRARQHKAGIDAALKAGIEHIVYTSGFSPQPPTPMFWDLDHWDTEQHLRATHAGWTILRNCEYMEIHLEGLWPSATVAGRLYSIAGDGLCAYISRDDCAKAAAAALASDATQNATLQITGPHAYSIDEAIGIYSQITGDTIEVAHTTRHDFEQVLNNTGVEQWLIDCYVALDEGIANGYYDVVTDAYESLTGQSPASLTDFLTERA